MQIRMIESGNILSKYDFFEIFDTRSFPDPLTKEALAEVGAELITLEEAAELYPMPISQTDPPT